MRKNLLIAAAVVPALLFTGCMGGTKKQVQDTVAEKAPLVKVDKAIVESVSRTADFTANLEAYLDYFIMPAMAARIDKIYVDVGDNVKAGQLLVDLDKTQLNTYKLQLSNAESNMARMMPVFENGGISKQQIDELETNISVLKETVANYETNLSFRSPINGVVAARYFEDGQLYAMSMNKDQTIGILRVMQMDKLKATVSVPEQYFPYVYMKMPVKVIADIYPGQEFEGEVTKIAPAISSSTRSFDVEVTVKNSSLTLRPGMFARTTFNMAQVESVTVLDLAVQKQAGTNDRYVYVIKDGKAERRLVVPGRQVGGRTEILSGVQEGEEIVTAGMSRLRTGSQVEIVK